MLLGEERGKYIGVKCKTPGCFHNARNNGYCVVCYVNRRRLCQTK